MYFSSTLPSYGTGPWDAGVEGGKKVHFENTVDLFG